MLERDLPEELALLRVERGGRLVEEQQLRLPGAVRPDQRDCLAGPELEVRRLERVRRAEAACDPVRAEEPAVGAHLAAAAGGSADGAPGGGSAPPSGSSGGGGSGSASV